MRKRSRKRQPARPGLLHEGQIKKGMKKTASWDAVFLTLLIPAAARDVPTPQILDKIFDLMGEFWINIP